jgi:hypothetical protein
MKEKIKTERTKGWECNLVIELFPSTCKVLGSICTTTTPPPPPKNHQISRDESLRMNDEKYIAGD